MTGIVYFDTKKALKLAVDEGENFWIEIPNPFEEKGYFISDMPDNTSVAVTNHPRRSWFATIEKKNRIIKVT